MNLIIFGILLIVAIPVLTKDEDGLYEYLAGDYAKGAENRPVREVEADKMVQNILQWLQTIYKENTRKTRQQSLVRGYLPPSNNPERPRPFEMTTSRQPFEAPSTRRPYETPSTRRPYEPTTTRRPYESSNTNSGQTGTVYTGNFYNPSTLGQPGPFSPASQPNFPSPTPSTPAPQPSFPVGSTQAPTQPGSFQPGGYPPSNLPKPLPPFQTGYQRPSPPLPAVPSRPSSGPFSTSQPSVPAYTSSRPTPSVPAFRPSTALTPTVTSAGVPYPSSSTPAPGTQNYRPGTRPFPTSPPPGVPYSSTTAASGTQSYIPPATRPFPTSPPSAVPFPSSTVRPGPVGGDDANHPPHIHSIDVDCARDMMTINIEFNRPYDGIIYSKGYFNSPECRYVQENSGQTRFTFTVSLNSCGTEFINGFDTLNQSYLENVLVLQNEPGIQEVWDSIRSVRCLWEGNLNKAVSIPLSIGMLNQEVVTFSGDTAMASLDLQLGRGPFAEPANGLIKIGEIMTLVVSITGDPGFDVRVRDCRARDSNSDNVIYLTDTNGCVLKPKIFGAFQKTRQTQNTGASIIAYAYFSAFKFPDMMDLLMECNVELCKTDCEMCPSGTGQIEPGRRRRDLHSLYRNINDTIGESVIVRRPLRVFLPEDLRMDESTVTNSGICMSLFGFAAVSGLVLGMLATSSAMTVYYWSKCRNVSRKC